MKITISGTFITEEGAALGDYLSHVTVKSRSDFRNEDLVKAAELRLDRGMLADTVSRGLSLKDVIALVSKGKE